MECDVIAPAHYSDGHFLWVGESVGIIITILIYVKFVFNCLIRVPKFLLVCEFVVG